MTTAIFTAVLVVCFFALMIGVGFACRKHATNVDSFVLGGLVLVPIVSLLTQKTQKDKARVEEIFTCYQEN